MSSRILSCCAVTALLVSAPQDSSAQHCASFEGVYTYAGGADQRGALVRALDDATAKMSVILRPLGGRLLRRGVKVPPRIVFTPDAQEVAITIIPYPPRQSRLDGTPAEVTNIKGNPATLKRVVRQGVISETLDDGRFFRKIEYRFGRSCESLTTDWLLRARIGLRDDLRYRLSYRRS